MTPYEELHAIANQLANAAAAGDTDSITIPLRKLGDATEQIRKSFSGSWLGYHSRVYYEGLIPPPPGANFSKEWGLKDLGFSSL
jgi:hypothetical protein